MVALNLALCRRYIYRAIARRNVDIRELATRTWTLCPEEHATTPPAIYLDGETDRIRGLSPWRRRDEENDLINGGCGSHGASLAHLIEGVQLVDGYLYKGAAIEKMGFGSKRWLSNHQGCVPKLTAAHLITGYGGSHFFGNLMLDDFPRALLPPPESPLIRLTTADYPHDDQYRSLLGLPSPEPVRRAHIKQLIMYTDFAQNSLKQARYLKLREALRAALANEVQPKPDGVYIRRGRTGELRLLENEPDIEAVVRKLGFDILDPSSLSAREISLRSLDAPIVIGVEGSHLSNAIFSAADHATFVVLQPPTRFAMVYKEFTDRVDMRFAFLVGDTGEEGFRVAPDHLLRLLDRVGRQ